MARKQIFPTMRKEQQTRRRMKWGIFDQYRFWNGLKAFAMLRYGKRSNWAGDKYVTERNHHWKPDGTPWNTLHLPLRILEQIDTRLMAVRVGRRNRPLILQHTKSNRNQSQTEPNHPGHFIHDSTIFFSGYSFSRRIA